MGITVFLFAVNIALTFLIFLLHVRFTRKEFAANRMLSLVLFSIFYLSFMVTLFYTKWIFQVPHFYRTGNFFIYLTYPAAYLYTRKILNQEGYRWADLLHAVPALIYVLDLLPFFTMDSAEKVRILMDDYGKSAIYSFRQSWFFPPKFHLYFRVALAVIYLVLMAVLWYRSFMARGTGSFRKENRSLMQWLAALIILLALEILPATILGMLSLEIDIVSFSNLVFYGIAVCFSLFLLFKPEILYGVKGLWLLPLSHDEKEKGLVQDMAEDAGTGPNEDGGRKFYLKQEMADQIRDALESTLLTQQKFLNKGYSMFDLAGDTGYSSHQLSAFINNHLGMNFKEYINTLRVKYLLEQVKTDPELEKYTLEALADRVGFNNRYSFLNAFKRVTGEIPSVVLKRRRQSE